MAGILGSLLMLGALLFALVLLLLLHELGHFALALACRMRVRELTIGFGAVLGSLSVRGVSVVIRCVPIAAWVRYERNISGQDSYSEASAWKRSLVDLGGPIASYATSAVLIFALALSGWLTPTPRQEAEPQAFSTAVELAVLVPLELTRDQVRALEGLLLRGEVERLQGPVAVGRDLAGAVRRGTVSFASTLAMLSVAIGFFNLLPIPGLDGGKFLLNLIDLARRRRLEQRTLEKVQATSLCGLLLVLVIVSIAEVSSLLLLVLCLLGIPLLIGAGIGLIHPAWTRISWRVVAAIGAAIGILIALFASVAAGSGVAIALGLVGTPLAIGVAAIAAGAYKLSAEWMRGRVPPA